MNITSILTLLGIFAGPVIALVSTSWFHRNNTRRASRITASYLAQHLDEFAYECAEVISDNELYSNSNGAAGSQTTAVPPLEKWPEAVDLGLVEPAVLSRVMSLRLKRTLSERRVKYWWDVAGDPSLMPEETGEQCGVLGSEALELARILRSGAGLPDPNYGQFHWDVSEILSEQKDGASRLKAEENEDLK